jgi:hypothetical protein
MRNTADRFTGQLARSNFWPAFLISSMRQGYGFSTTVLAPMPFAFFAASRSQNAGWRACDSKHHMPGERAQFVGPLRFKAIRLGEMFHGFVVYKKGRSGWLTCH